MCGCEAAREEAMPEFAGPAKVVAAVATGSLPVSSEWVRYAAEEIAERAWQELQSGLYRLTTDAVEEIMRRHAACATERQPEENT